MTLVELVRRLKLPFADGPAPISEAVRAGDAAKVLGESGRLLECDPANADAAAMYVIAHAFGKFGSPLDEPIAATASQWLRRDDVKSDVRVHMMFGAALADFNPADLEQVLLALVRSGSDAAGVVFPLCGFLPIDKRSRMLSSIAQHPNEDAREHFFALLGKHQRLVPPGTVRFDFVPNDLMTALLASAISDIAPRVRERAIAAAYGLGLVPQLRDTVLARVSDADSSVRQYAIVALGVLRDAESRDRLLELLRTGSKEEATSALWALARRADGIEDVLRLAGDSRGWINDELLGAFAEVSVPLTDEQIAKLERSTSSPAFAALRRRHIERTRHGAPESGPDARFAVVSRG